MLKKVIKSSAIIFFGMAIPVAYHSSSFSSLTFELEKSNTNQDTKNQNNVK